MATSTPNLNLILPDYSDKADISVLNDNFQKIDEYCANGGVSNEDLQNAVKAANAWANATASAESVSADKEADVNLTEGDNSKNLHFSIPRGQPGVLISETEPTDPNVKVWIKPDGEPNELEQLKSDVSSLKDQKANVIIDTSARAASHELHAQDGDMKVTLYGKTTETGTGDKSPDNPYTISGVDTAQVYACGKNLFNTPEASTTVRNVTYTLDGKGNIKISGTHETAGNIFMLDIPNPITIQPGMRIVIDATEASGSHGLNFRNTKTGDARTINAQAGKVVTFDVGANHAGQTFNHFRDWLGTNTVYNDTLKIMFTYSSDNTFEPYTANTITPPLLPDGSPLMGNGTVDDTVENDVPSGCDVKLTFKSADGWRDRSPDLTKGVYSYTPPLAADAALVFFSNKAVVANAGGIVNANKYPVSTSSSGGTLYVYFPECTTLEELDAYFAANPLTVFYRSTEYTPEKDLRVCKVVRNWKNVKVSDLTWKREGSNGKGLTSYYAAAVGTVFGNGNVYCEALPTGVAQWNSATTMIYRVTGSNRLHIIIDPALLTSDTVEGLLALVGDAECVYQVNPETYMADPLDLRKPYGMEAVTVTGSAETAVSYPCDTKSYIDRKFDALAAALLS